MMSHTSVATKLFSQNLKVFFQAKFCILGSIPKQKKTYKLQIFVKFWVRCKPICAHYSQSSFANIEAKIFAKPFSLAKIVVYRLSPFKWIYQNMVIKCRLWRERVPDAADTPILTGFLKYTQTSLFSGSKDKKRQADSEFKKCVIKTLF